MLVVRFGARCQHAPNRLIVYDWSR